MCSLCSFTLLPEETTRRSRSHLRHHSVLGCCHRQCHLVSVVSLLFFIRVSFWCILSHWCWFQGAFYPVSALSIHVQEAIATVSCSSRLALGPAPSLIRRYHFHRVSWSRAVCFADWNCLWSFYLTMERSETWDVRVLSIRKTCYVLDNYRGARIADLCSLLRSRVQEMKALKPSRVMDFWKLLSGYCLYSIRSQQGCSGFRKCFRVLQKHEAAWSLQKRPISLNAELNRMYCYKSSWSIQGQGEHVIASKASYADWTIMPTQVLLNLFCAISSLLFLASLPNATIASI